MEATVTERGWYTPHPSDDEQPTEWSTGRHYRPTTEPARAPTPPTVPESSATQAGAGHQRQAATQTDEQDSEALVELRNQVVDRLRLMNARHAHRAWEMAEGDPIAPHGLAFFYADHDAPPDSRHAWQVVTATRLFLDGPETGYLPRLLWEQARIANGYRRAGTLDPRTQLANRSEPMTTGARYLGVGVSTVDLPEFPWAHQRQSRNGYDIVGRCFALLVDGTWLLLDRGHHTQFTALRIWSSRTLDTSAHLNLRRWNWGRHLPELADPATREIWVQLQGLHRVLAEATCPGAGHGH
jgi:hypothetical protein